jgi:hypothetical protein
MNVISYSTNETHLTPRSPPPPPKKEKKKTGREKERRKTIYNLYELSSKAYNKLDFTMLFLLVKSGNLQKHFV